MPSSDLLDSCAHLAGLWWTRVGGVPCAPVAAARLDALVGHAREHSPFYRELYAALPRGPLPLAALPPVCKARLMARFDDWVTDPRVRLRGVRRFLADRGRVGERYLGRYGVWKSSGTGGTPGIFVHDAHALAAYDALVWAQLAEARWRPDAPARALARGSKAALVAATGDHFAAAASWVRMRRALPALDARGFSVLEPLPRLVAALDRFQPGVLAGYPTLLAMLAAEQAAGRLHIAPVLAWSGGEHLGAAARRAIEEAFACPVLNEYGASECLSIAHECAHGAMHLHGEWALLEGVDRDGRPTPPGVLSDTTLLTNLANRVQPVIRYDLGDRIVALAGPCACGSALPAFRLEGRTEEPLVLRSGTGARVRLAPLAIETVVEAAAHGRPFQVAQRGPTRLALRFDDAAGARDRAPGRAAAAALRHWLRTQSLGNVQVVLARGAPRPERPGGKLRCVVAENPAAA